MDGPHSSEAAEPSAADALEQNAGVERRPRIVFFTPVTPGSDERNGFATRLDDLLSTLAETCEIDLFVPADAEGQSPDALRSLRSRQGISLHTYSAGPPPHQSRNVRRAQRVLHYVFDPLPLWSSPRRSPELAHHLASRPVDVLCLYLPITAHLADLAPSDTPVILMLEEGLERDLLAPRERSRLLQLAARSERLRVRRLYRRVGGLSRTVVAISGCEAAAFAGRGIDPAHIVVVPRGLDLDHFSPSGPTAEPTVDVSMFGDFNFERNFVPALDLATQAASRYPELSLAFVGDIAASAASQLRSLGATVTGRVEDMRPHYRRTRVVVVPAITGTGVKTTLLEAWAMGRPVVTTPPSALGVEAEDGVDVLIGRSTDQLLRLCSNLLQSPDRQRELARNGRLKMEASHDAAVISEEFVAVVSAAARGLGPG